MKSTSKQRMMRMVAKQEYVCIHEDKFQEAETKLTYLESRMEFKEEKIDQIIMDFKNMDKKLDKITDNIHQLQLDSARDDFNIDNRVTQLETTVRVLKWVSGFLVSVVVMALTLATFMLTHTI